MVTFLITSLFIIGLLAVAIYYWQKPNSPTEPRTALPEPYRRSLFEIPEASAAAKTNPESDAERVEILARAQAGESAVLNEALRSSDPNLYRETLDSLVAQAQSAQLLSLVSYVARNQLPVNTTLAEKFIDSWKQSPSRNSTAEMLHVAALSDDARLYNYAVETALACWSNGDLASVSAEELKTLIESEFWVLSSAARSSGAGFTLKLTLASARRELDAARSHNADASA